MAPSLAAFASDVLQGLHLDGDRGELDVWWLGQAGFLIRSGNKRVVIDPYLSNSLAKKYSGTRFPHQRMAPPPVEPQNLFPVDYIFVTHGHTDHMDPETLRPIAAANPNCTFVVPSAEKAKAADRGVPEGRLASIDANDRMRLDACLSLIAIPAAHEDLKRDAQGRHFFLGYALCVEERPVLYHSGDCIPYAGLSDRLSGLDIDLALLPINGRDSVRTRERRAWKFFAQRGGRTLRRGENTVHARPPLWNVRRKQRRLGGGAKHARWPFSRGAGRFVGTQHSLSAQRPVTVLRRLKPSNTDRED